MQKSLTIEPFRLEKRRVRYNSSSATVKVGSQIRLKGTWLRQAGFEPGQKVYCKINNGQITLCNHVIYDDANLPAKSVSDSEAYL